MPDPRRTPLEEIRLAVVLNGGVSLAVWMGGACLEIDRMTKAGTATAQPPNPYDAILDMVRSSARVDVLSGTSAGGINGAALALAQTNEFAHLEILRDLWADGGRMQSMLRQPFRGSPSSLLQGDEYFLPQMQRAFTRLADPFEPRDDHPIDLTITTTLLTGAPLVTVDGLGQRLPQSIHDGRFRFVQDPDLALTDLGDPVPTDAFTKEKAAETAQQLALAARATSSFPIAFEPSFVPVDHPGTGDTASPDMATCASWASRTTGCTENPDRSRFTVDGGLLANTPTVAALQAINRMPAHGPTRRVMLLVYPHAPAAMPSTSDDESTPPTITALGGKIIGALSSHGSRTFVNEIEAHNKAARGRRQGRTEIIEAIPTGPVGGKAYGLRSLARTLEPHHRRLRVERAAQKLAMRVPPQESWSTDRVRFACESAHRTWLQDHGSLPYIPADRTTVGPTLDPTVWNWGDETAAGVAEAALDLIRRSAAVCLATAEEERHNNGPLGAERAEVHRSRTNLRKLRNSLDLPWLTDPELRGLEPDESYWRLRLAAYEYHMIGDDRSLARFGLTHLAPAAARARAFRLPDAENAPAPGLFGKQVRDEAERIARAVHDTIRRIRGIDAGAIEQARLAEWLDLFAGAATDDDVLALLVDLEIASFCLLDEAVEGESVIRLVQMSMQTDNPFAEVSLTPDDKVGGMGLHRFAGFLKQSWRVNDWIWGRLDAATTLCRVVLTPERLRRVAVLENRTAGHEQAWLDELLADLFGTELPTGVPFDHARKEALGELAEILDPAKLTGDLPPAAEHLAALAAWAVHIDVILRELPALAAGVRADRTDGANSRSRGELFLQNQAALLKEVESFNSRTEDEGPRRVALGVRALHAFDCAGIGREQLAEEGTSDQMIATATTSAAVAVTTIDGPHLGVPALRPLTRTLRGAALLPYWVITGLTRAGSTARLLALTALAIGGMLLLISMFGSLPNWAAGPTAIVGISALLTGIGYAALRSGTLLHGLVLLSPVVPLLVYATSNDDGEPSGDLFTVGVVLVAAAIIAALLILGSLPAPVHSPVAVLKDHWKRLALGAGAVIGVVAVAVASWRYLPGWISAVRSWLGQHSAPDPVFWWSTAVAVVVLVLAGAWTFWIGRSMQILTEVQVRADVPTTEEEFQKVVQPAAVTASWAFVYGVLYLAAALLLWHPAAESNWALAGFVVAGSFGVLLALVVPTVVVMRCQRRIRRRLTLAAPAIPDLRAARTSAGQVDAGAAAAALLRHLKAHGMTYRFLVATGAKLTRYGTKTARDCAEKAQA